MISNFAQKLVLVLLVIFCCQSAFTQSFSSTDPAYVSNVKLGESALKAEKYDSCLVYYMTAFEIKQTSVLSTLRMAACAFSAGSTDAYEKQISKAFDLDWAQAHGIYNDYPEFEYLKGGPFEEDINRRYEIAAKASGIDLKLVAEFDKIRETDQAQRREMGPISDKYGWKSPQMDSLWAIQNLSDSLNTLRISEIIDEMGYPGKSIVGARHQGTAFLVIQHADLEVQEKNLPIITAAADAGEVRWASVALLIDRVRQRQGKKQIYGSQVSRDPETNQYYFGAIDQPFKVDSVRASVGLGPLNDYAKNWDFEYDAEKHVKFHEALEEKKEQSQKE